MSSLRYKLLSVLILVLGLGTFHSKGLRSETPQIESSVTFFYYRDMKEAESFYADVIGLRKILDEGWVKMFQIPGGGIVGLVDEEHSTPGLSEDKPVMLSIVTPDLEQWYERIKSRAPQSIRKKLKTGEDVGILVNAFLLSDPGGYPLEFFRWKKGKGPGNVAGKLPGNEPRWRGSTTQDKMFFTLGMMNAYAEAVRNRAKILGLGEPLTAEETDALYAHAEKIAEHNNVEIYNEPDLLVTDLFPAHITKDRHVILIYTGDTLDRYLAIKADKEILVKNGEYTGEARRNIARRFGQLLSYRGDVIEEKISKNYDID